MTTLNEITITHSETDARLRYTTPLTRGAREACQRLGITDEHLELVLDDPDFEVAAHDGAVWLSRGNVSVLEADNGTVLKARPGVAMWFTNEIEDDTWYILTTAARNGAERCGLSMQVVQQIARDPERTEPARDGAQWRIRDGRSVLVAGTDPNLILAVIDSEPRPMPADPAGFTPEV